MLNKKIKALVVIGILVAIYPTSKWLWGEASKAYFNYRCGQDAGEFIYRTVDNVEGLFQMRPREQRDYFDSLRSGNLLEDPYGHTNFEAQSPWHLFLRYPKTGKPTYTYLESVQGPDLKKYALYKFYKNDFSKKPEYTNEPYWLYTYDSLKRSKTGLSYGVILSAEQISKPKSKYGYTWRQFQNDLDKLFNVYGGELIVKELATDETLGIRRGYFIYSAWPRITGGCPKYKNPNIAFEFISKVLIPAPFDSSSLEEKIYGD